MNKIEHKYIFINFFFALIIAFEYAFQFTTGSLSYELMALAIRIKLAFPIIIILFFIPNLFLSKKENPFLKLLLLAIMLSIFYCIIGFINNWLLMDIIGDTILFFAPILTAAVAFSVFFRMERFYRNNFITQTLSLLLILFVVSVLRKTLKVLNGEDLVAYAQDWMFTPLPLAAVALGFYFSKKISIFLIISMIISPILAASKTMFISFYTVLLVRFKSLFLIILVFSFFILVNSVNDLKEIKIFDRINAAFNSLTKKNKKDLSTGARLTEINNVLHLMVEEPYSLPFGKGSGALWYDKLGIYYGGLNDFNFRKEKNNGAHHIHQTYILILFRYGLIGLVVYLIFITKCVKMSLNNRNLIIKIKNKKLTGISFFYYFLMAIIMSITTVNIFYGLEWAIMSGWLAATIKADKKIINPIFN